MARLVTTAAWPFMNLTHVFPTHLRLDSLAVGVLLAWLVRRGMRARPWTVPVGLAGIALVLQLPIEHAFAHTLGFLVLALGCGALVLAAHCWTPDGAFAHALARVGRDSYAIYLWHVPVRRGLDAIGVASAPSVTGALFFIVASLAVGMLATQWIEAPALRWRDRRWPRPAHLSRPRTTR
jgi:peptidoglycan/LPS O-acetylase OafA/YrhL